jgi:hypothetical protein
MYCQDIENTLKNTISMRNRTIARGEEVFEESTGCPEWPLCFPEDGFIHQAALGRVGMGVDGVSGP